MSSFYMFLVYFSLFILSACSPKSTLPIMNNPAVALNTSINARELVVDEKGLSTMRAILKTTKGDFIVKFYPRKAPETVARVIQLLQFGFYDGLAFHRVEKNYLIQTGDPKTASKASDNIFIKDEFHNVPHTRGILAMAKSSYSNSASTQFYIALNTLNHLDGKYTVFGKVVEGEDLLSQITLDDKILSFALEVPN